MRILLLLILLFPQLATAQVQPPDEAEHSPPADLSVGGQAPPLTIAEWVQGPPVTSFEDGRIYIVEFWATWCGPCIRGIPHLTEFQKKHPDVQVISVAIWQREKTQAERNEAVKAFVAQRSKMAADQNDPSLAMTYTIAVDQDRRTAEAWMEAAGRMGIPSAFIVGRAGQIEWIGHPYTGDQMVNAFDAYVAGQWDRAAFRQRYVEENAFAIARGKVAAALRRADETGSPVEALSVLNRSITTFPTVTAFKLDKLQLLMKTTPSQADDYARSLAQDEWEHSDTLNAMAWMMVDETNVKKRNLDLALKCAARADTLENHQDPNILDTLARVYWARGDAARAITIQQRAVEKAGTAQKGQFQEVLERYRSSPNGS